jgi:hypothetical protein
MESGIGAGQFRRLSIAGCAYTLRTQRPSFRRAMNAPVRSGNRCPRARDRAPRIIACFATRASAASIGPGADVLDAGWEAVSFIEGECRTRCPVGYGHPETLREVARRIRRGTTRPADFPREGPYGASRDGGDEVICPHDFAPYNFVFASFPSRFDRP